MIWAAHDMIETVDRVRAPLLYLQASTNQCPASAEMEKQDGVTTFDFGEWKGTVASRKNDEGTISFTEAA